jgi:hypothetical protein
MGLRQTTIAVLEILVRGLDRCDFGPLAAEVPFFSTAPIVTVVTAKGATDP